MTAMTIKPEAVDPEDVEMLQDLVISAVKEAEDGNGYILRLYETGGVPASGRVALPALGVDALVSLAPQEIKTLRVLPETGDLREVLITEW